LAERPSRIGNGMSEIITVENLVLTYGDGTKAVQDISFTVREGEFFGFLGPNGAGKSTTIKVLTTLLRKTKGRVTVGGYDLDTKAGEIRKMIGVQSQETVVDGDLTGRENLILQGNLEQMRGSEIRGRVDELLKLVELSEVAGKRAAFYSGGMKKRLDLASALVNKPRILFLDEPTTGLDVQSRASIWSYLERLNREEGITIFLTTQYMEEADRLCRKLSIIDHGQLVASGSPSELKREIGADTITLSLAEDGTGDADLKSKAKQILGTLQGVGEVRDSDGGLTLYAKHAGFIVADIVRAFDASGLKLSQISVATPTLGDVFLKHTGRKIRPEELARRESTFSRFGTRRRPTRE
jgi:ABC-2 type transport system ATP-binding protein